MRIRSRRSQNASARTGAPPDAVLRGASLTWLRAVTTVKAIETSGPRCAARLQFALYPQGIECGSLFSACRKRQAFLFVPAPPLARHERVKKPAQRGFPIHLPMIRRRAVVMRRRTMMVVVMMRRHMVATRDQPAMHPYALAYGTGVGRCRYESTCGDGQQHQRHQFAHEISCSMGRHFKRAARFVQCSTQNRSWIV